MHSSRFILRRAVGCALALAIVLAAPAAAADRVAAQAQYYASFRHQEPIAGAAPQALYYASFRDERPLPAPSSDSGSDGWIVPGVGVVVALLVTGAGAVEFRRLRLRQRVRVAA